jgi:hypothetical protein
MFASLVKSPAIFPVISSPFDGGGLRWGWTKPIESRFGPPSPSSPPTAWRGDYIGDFSKGLGTTSQIFMCKKLKRWHYESTRGISFKS